MGLQKQPIPHGVTPPINAWDALRQDWARLLLDTIHEEDIIGQVTAVSEDSGTVQPVEDLQGAHTLGQTLKALKVKHPDPLCLRISAIHDGQSCLRWRFLRADAAG